jgi:hypothetical protein
MRKDRLDPAIGQGHTLQEVIPEPSPISSAQNDRV